MSKSKNPFFLFPGSIRALACGVRRPAGPRALPSGKHLFYRPHLPSQHEGGYQTSSPARIWASLAMRTSSGVAGRPPILMMKRSQSSTVNGGWLSSRVSKKGSPESVFPKETDVFLCMGLEIADRILKNILSTGLEKPVFCKCSPAQTKNVLMRGSVRGVVSGHTM